MSVKALQGFFKGFAEIISYLISYFWKLGTAIFMEHLRVAACQKLNKNQNYLLNFIRNKLFNSFKSIL